MLFRSVSQSRYRPLSYRGSVAIYDSKVVVRACLMDSSLSPSSIDVSSINPVVYSSLDTFLVSVRYIFGSSDILFHHV